MITEVKRFILLSDTGSVSSAARKLHITQPALSLSIKRLENELGYKLFTLINKRMTITNNGQDFYRLAQKMISLWEDARQWKLKKEIINIGLYDNAAHKLVDFLEQELQNKKYLLEISIDKSKLLIQDLSQGLIDLCICVIDPTTTIPANITQLASFQEELLPVSNKKFNENLQFILYNKNSLTRIFIDNIFAKNDIKPHIAVESSSPTFMKDLAVRGAGIALLPYNLIRSELDNKNLVIQKLPYKFFRTIGLFKRKSDEKKLITELGNKIEKVLTHNKT